MAAAVTPSIPVQALVIYGITATTIIDSSTAAVVDNRSPSRRNGIHSYRAYGTGTWSVEIFFADGDPSGWVSYGSTGQVDQSSQNGIGYGIDPNIDGKTYHDFIQFVITGDAAIQSYCGLKDVWSLPSQGSLSFPVSPSNGGTGQSTVPVTSLNGRSGDVSLTAADVEAVEQDLQTSASPTFDGLTTSTATLGTATITSGTITALTATSAAIATLTSTSVAVTRTGAVPVTVTRTDGGTALSVVIGNVVLASGTLTASGTVTGGALSTTGALTAASATISGALTVGSVSAGSFSSTSPFSIIVASGVALVASQTSGGTAISIPVGNIVLAAGSVTVSGDIASATIHASGNAAIAGSLASGPTTVTGALAVSGAATAASAAVAGLVAAGSLTSAATIVATGGITGGSVTTAGALTAASATLSGAAISASLKITTLSIYANNAAALTGGLVAGQVYRITGSDTLGVVH